MQQRFQDCIAYVNIIADIALQAVQGFEPNTGILVVTKGGNQSIANVIVTRVGFEQIDGIKADIRIAIAMRGQKQKLLNARIVRRADQSLRMQRVVLDGDVVGMWDRSEWIRWRQRPHL